MPFQISGRPCLDGQYFFLKYLVESINEATCPGVSFVIRTELQIQILQMKACYHTMYFFSDNSENLWSQAVSPHSNPVSAS